jgi:hypothetical protein
MGTRSTIALEFADGTVEQVYCHWDGYLDNNGKILAEHYSDPFKLQALIDLGGLSSLRPNIGVKHAFSALGLPEAEREAFEAKHADSCTFYGRDRGEDVAKEKFADFADYVENFMHEEYAYILRTNGVWYVKCHSADFVTLAEAFEAEKEQA